MLNANLILFSRSDMRRMPLFLLLKALVGMINELLMVCGL